MSQLVIPEIECVENQDNYGRFVAGPLLKDFGITLGNSLRRVLLGHIPGAAVTQVIIEGIQHEFSPIPHVKEDTIEFLLNIKALRLKPISGQPGKLVLEVEREGRVCAADIKPSADFEIANPELYLVTLDSPQARLYIEFDVEMGEGYRQAEAGDNLPIGVIPVDAIFTPIQKVNFTVEPVQLGRETSLERLHMEIWTDGTVLPGEALSDGASILTEQLTPFISFARVSPVTAEEERFLTIPEEQFNKPVDELELSVRTLNCLRRGGIVTVGDIISRGEKELLSLRNFGLKSKREIDEALDGMGLSLKQAEEEEEVLEMEGEAAVVEEVPDEA